MKIHENKVYENQTVEAEIKIYVPLDIARGVRDWGVPEFERSGLAVWRFEPADSKGQVNLLGQPYVSLSYPTTMTAIKNGEVTIGPATVRLTYEKRFLGQFGPDREQVQATLDVPELKFEVTPLPEGAPEGFDNAVGSFSLGTAIKQTQVVEGEPLSVDVVVTGTGNLDNLRSPEMIDDTGWKVYESTQNLRGDERRYLSGTVVFSQFIRPLEMKTSVPPFRLVFFDPDLEAYQTVATEPIMLEMTPSVAGRGMESSGPPQSMSVPIERMTDILGIVSGKALVSGRGATLPNWFWHALGGLVALGLIARALWMRYGHLLEKDETKSRMKRDFSLVSDAVGADAVRFLKAAGMFVEKWLSPQDNETAREVLRERDDLCFRQTKENATLPRKRQEEILRNLKKAAFSLLTFGLVIFASADARADEAADAYESAKYGDAAKLWLDAGPFENLSPDTLYNIGNAAYRMGAPGQAALYYRRALARDSAHGEARQNLRFLERKYGSITVDRPEYQYALGKIALSAWQTILWGGLWMMVIGLLVFPATRRGSRWRVAGVLGFVVGPLMMSLGALGWRYYPDDAEFAPLARQGVVVGDKVVVHTDAARTSPEVIDAPPGSLAEVIRRSGKWAYISFATKTRGWVPVNEIEMIVPQGKPEAPEVRKASSDGSSA